MQNHIQMFQSTKTRYQAIYGYLFILILSTAPKTRDDPEEKDGQGIVLRVAPRPAGLNSRTSDTDVSSTTWKDVKRPYEFLETDIWKINWTFESLNFVFWFFWGEQKSTLNWAKCQERQGQIGGGIWRHSHHFGQGLDVRLLHLVLQVHESTGREELGQILSCIQNVKP